MRTVYTVPVTTMNRDAIRLEQAIALRKRLLGRGIAVKVVDGKLEVSGYGHKHLTYDMEDAFNTAMVMSANNSLNAMLEVNQKRTDARLALKRGENVHVPAMTLGVRMAETGPRKRSECARYGTPVANGPKPLANYVPVTKRQQSEQRFQNTLGVVSPKVGGLSTVNRPTVDNGWRVGMPNVEVRVKVAK